MMSIGNGSLLRGRISLARLAPDSSGESGPPPDSFWICGVALGTAVLLHG